MKLSPRLECVANYAENGAKIADIGTDHALIPIYLLLNEKINYSVASDVNDGPLEKARENIEKYHMQDKIRLCRADGLAGIKDDEVDTVIIAGMGGELISEIITQRIPKGVETIIFQPMSNAHELRMAIQSCGFSITHEKLVAEKTKIYNIIYAQKGSQQWSERQCRISPLLKKDPLYTLYIKKELKKINNAIAQLKATDEKIILNEFIKLKSWYEQELI